ncbi:MAG TPA: PQQ-binding-like beta-propeller repeat protein [Pirellulaceae bacterium]|nr:PQQ-binding-like beta-propeller repeat protein [Pirellulaceae bacterium]
MTHRQLSMSSVYFVVSLALYASLCTSVLAVEPPVLNWPGWRGPKGDGSSPETNLPTTWNGTTGENVVWKTAIPGTGHSSPIVWGERIFVVSCLPDSGDRVLLSLDRKTGAVLWQQTVLKAPLEKKHTLNSYASGTPATDGRLVYVSFLEPDFASQKERTPGNMVVAAYDFEGNLKWSAKPGRFASTHGYCSSPVLFEDKVIINGDHDGDGYIAALARESGQEIWRIERPNNTRSYVTPLIRDIAGKTQMLLSGSKCTASYDPRTGKELWRMDGPTEQFVASLVDDGRYVYLTAGFPERHILAIDPSGQGHVEDDKIVWRTKKNCSYVPSPVICGEHFVVAADDGIASCYQAQSGELQWTARLGKHYSASLVTAGGLVYLLADDGIMKVVRPGPELDVVAENPLGEYCYASPALSQGQILVRGEEHLYCIGR